MALQVYHAAQATGKPLVPTNPPQKIWVSSQKTGVSLSFRHSRGATLIEVPRYVIDTYDLGRDVTVVQKGASGPQTPRVPARGPQPTPLAPERGGWRITPHPDNVPEKDLPQHHRFKKESSGPTGLTLTMSFAHMDRYVISLLDPTSGSRAYEHVVVQVGFTCRLRRAIVLAARNRSAVTLAARWYKDPDERRMQQESLRAELDNVLEVASTPRAETIAQSYDYSAGVIGGAPAKEPKWFYSPNRNLDRWRRSHKPGERNADGSVPVVPDGEGVIDWAPQTCNVFVYDVLYAAGCQPPLSDVRHYFSPSHTYFRRGAGDSLKSYFAEIRNPRLIEPGDIAVSEIHMEIVTTKPDYRRANFIGIGGHSTGAYPARTGLSNSYKYLRLKRCFGCCGAQPTPCRGWSSPGT